MATFWRDADRSAVTVQEAVGEWSLVAWDVLEDVAGTWRRTISEDRLAVEVQKRSGIVTSLPPEQWIGHVVGLVARRAREDRGPALTSFVVDATGMVPASYGEVLAAEGLSDDPEARVRHALDARLLCHKIYGARIPAGADLLEPVAPARRTPGRPSSGASNRVVPAVAEPPRAKVCPTCFIQLPATGQCDYCS